MATPASSSLFMSLGNAWRLLTLRSDIDDIILELLGHFSLDKIYAESDKEAYQNLLITLVSQLNTIFYLQRLTLPSENLQAGSIGWYLGFLASWEVTFRSLEFVLQVVHEGRESLWDAAALRDLYLPEFILSSLRLLTLHPKAPTNQRAKDRRERFARVDRSLERIHDSYPGPKSFLFLLCREVTNSLRNEPNALALPTKMRYELPNLASDLYPLTECLSSQYVATIVPHHGFASQDWVPQYLALRDISQFLVGASIQYSVNRETRDVRLQSSSARTRNAVLLAVDNLRIPEHLSHFDIAAPFSETFRVILPDTPHAIGPDSVTANSHETKMDATDALCLRLCDRMVIHRVSDREMMHSLSELSRSLSLLDDPSASLLRPVRPRVYALNCPHAHLAGDTQLRSTSNLKFPDDPPDGAEIKLPAGSKCLFCGEPITVMREVAVARQTWDILKPLEPNPDTINVERHLRTQFQLTAPRFENIPQGAPYGNLSSRGSQPSDADVASQRPSTGAQSNPHPPEPRTISQAIWPGGTPRAVWDEVQTDLVPPENATFDSSEGTTHSHSEGRTIDTQTVQTSIGDTQYPHDNIVSPITPSVPLPFRLPRTATAPISPSTSTYDHALTPTLSGRTVPPAPTPKPKKAGLFSRLQSKREAPAVQLEIQAGGRSPLPQETTEEISLMSLIAVPKSLLRSKTAKTIRDVNVSLSQNSPHALFWSPSFIHLLDISSSPPKVIQALATDSTCVQATVTRVHLAYIIKSSDQKLTLRITNLASPQTPVVEYRMPQTPYCTSIAICPRENVVVVGFESPIVRFFSTSKSEPPREDHLHSRYHDECKEKECPPISTLAFSNDGLSLLASVRSLKNGMISFYSWHHPLDTFQEESKCRHHVALHESEDNGVTSAIYRPGYDSDPSLICATTWTLSGVPQLIQVSDGQKTEVKTERGGHYGQIGSRIQAAAFSSSGGELAVVNAKGHVYQVANLEANPIDARRIGASIELTKKEGFFAMTYMTLPEEEAVVLAWADSSKALGYIKKIPTKSLSEALNSAKYNHLHTTLHEVPAPVHYELSGEGVQPPVEMNAPDVEAPPYSEKAREEFGL